MWRLSGLFWEVTSFPRNYNAWKYCWLRCRKENVQTGLACDAWTCSLCPLGSTCASFLEDCSLYGRDDGQGPSGQMHRMACWLREGDGNGAGQGQAALRQMGGRLKHPGSFSCLPSACSMAEAKNLHPAQKGLPLSARLPNYSLGFSWCHPPPLSSPKMCAPSTAVFLARGFPASAFCSVYMQIGVTACNSRPPCAPAAVGLFAQVPW